LGKLPRQNLSVLEAIIRLHEKNGEDRKYSYHELYSLLHELNGKTAAQNKITFDEMDSVMEVLQNYNIIEIDKQGRNVNKTDSKNIRFALKEEYSDLVDALNTLN